MTERIIPLLSLESCSRVITEGTFGEVSDYAGHTSYRAPGCRIYSRSYIYEPDEGRFGEEFYDIADAIKDLRKEDDAGMFSFLREEAPLGFETRLKELGAKKRGSQTGMILKIDYFNKLTEKGTVRIISEEQVPEWENVLFEGFGDIKVREDGLYSIFYDCEGVSLYACFENDKIIGTSMLLTEGDLSSIHEVTVLPEFRKRGAGEAMIIAMINDLKKRKIRIVSLQASPMGAPLYKRLGFEETGHIETWHF